MSQDASEEVIKTAIENSTRAAIADGTIKIISGALSEGFVEGTQEFGDVGLKNIVNGMMEKDYFADAPDLTTLKGVRETYMIKQKSLVIMASWQVLVQQVVEA